MAKDGDETDRPGAFDGDEHARERLRSVLETVPGYLTIVDRDGTIEYINRSYPGLGLEQVIGTSVLNWLDPAYRDRMMQALATVFCGESVEPLVTIGTSADGGVTWFRTSFGVLRKDDRIVAATLYGEDITRQMRSDQMRARAARFEAIGRVTGSIGHGLNNLLMAMGAAVDLLALTHPSIEGSQEVELLRSSIEHAADVSANLTGSLRDPSREPAVVELVAELRSTEALLRQAAGGRAHFEVIYPDADTFIVRIAPHELSQVLINLITNAREAMSRGGSIEVSFEEQLVEPGEVDCVPEGRYAVISVADTGAGIPVELRERVFDPFFTTKQTRSGFGLSTCYAIVKARGGMIELASGSPNGTVVRVWLPTIAQEWTSDPAEVFMAPPTLSTRPAVIALAEDEPRARNAMARYLSHFGHVVLEARDGQDALEVIGRHPGTIDILVTDLRMPRRDGTELIAALRNLRPDLPVIVVTGAATDDELAPLQRLGVAIHRKPQALRVLYEQIMAMLSR